MRNSTHRNQIKPREKSNRHLDVLCHRLSTVVVTSRRICRRQNGHSRRQRADDACFCDGYRLLLHGFQKNLLLVPHLIELVDATEPAVAKNERSGFQTGLVRRLSVNSPPPLPYLSTSSP